MGLSICWSEYARRWKDGCTNAPCSKPSPCPVPTAYCLLHRALNPRRAPCLLPTAYCIVRTCITRAPALNVHVSTSLCAVCVCAAWFCRATPFSSPSRSLPVPQLSANLVCSWPVVLWAQHVCEIKSGGCLCASCGGCLRKGLMARLACRVQNLIRGCWACTQPPHAESAWC